MSSRLLYLHVGASKTGTSALQRGLFNSAPTLAEQGVDLPFTSREEHVRHLLRPLGWVTAEGFAGNVPRRRRLRSFRARLGAATADRVLLTCEDLCEADHARIEILADASKRAGVEMRVVVTARDLATVIPSEWQQFLKHRLTLDYPTFLDRLRDHQGRWAEHFWLRQDIAAICHRWSEVVGKDRIEVIATPDRLDDPDGLYRLFGDVVGFDPSGLDWPQHNVNASWGYVEAEVYRRVNQALGDRLGNYEEGYQPGLRWPFVLGVLPRSASTRIPLPPEALPWVRERASEQVSWLRNSGIRVHGDLDSLVPTPDRGADLPPLDDTAVAQAAVNTLANFAVFAHRRRTRLETATRRGAARGIPERLRRWLLSPRRY